jgi:hypothetical protein
MVSRPQATERWVTRQLPARVLLSWHEARTLTLADGERLGMGQIADGAAAAQQLEHVLHVYEALLQLHAPCGHNSGSK